MAKNFEQIMDDWYQAVRDGDKTTEKSYIAWTALQLLNISVSDQVTAVRESGCEPLPSDLPAFGYYQSGYALWKQEVKMWDDRRKQREAMRRLRADRKESEER